MEQFNLDIWLKDKSRKVVTRDGRPVRIVCTDSPILHHPIVGFVECDLFTWTDDGKVIYGGKCEDKNDLFFADKEEKLTEFEDKLLAFALMFGANIEEEKIEYVKESSKTLLDLARKEILKDLPKWKKATENLEFSDNVVKMDEYGNILCFDIAWVGEYYIDVQSLKSLPKEE